MPWLHFNIYDVLSLISHVGKLLDVVRLFSRRTTSLINISPKGHCRSLTVARNPEQMLQRIIQSCH
jgi:hypothetical protein